MGASILRFFRLFLLALIVLMVTPLGVFALDVPTPPSDVPIVDQTNTLTAEQKAELASIIANERQHSGNQIGVLMIPSLEGEALEDYSIDAARQWGIGSKERNNGVLLLVVKDDRRVRIEVGYGLEGALTDIRSGQIIRDRMAPQFREGKYFEGIKLGLEGITKAIHNEVDPTLQTQPQKKSPTFPWEFIFIALLVLPSWLASILARTKSWWAGGVLGGIAGIVIALFVGFLFLGLISIIALVLVGLLFDRVVSSNYQRRASEGLAPSWWAGGTHLGGGGGSGGFGGFGGGSFGGGGASGDW
ncbi:MAG: hypothetical protein JWP13_115 [Candidatus Saccharibacteria bacterium]|nr:hypothetical protein [Candidatus Saccharibacteria bacterium]